ncbi:hypothetical protein [Sinorhizobium meliloti]|uniref:hypothetical protein n=1 Tax=Rhizobium meliloti TaxID=382 RepID=UPI003D651235
MTETSKERIFVDQANPQRWLLVADNLHVQATEGWNRFGGGRIAMVDGQARLVGEWDDVNRTVFLLCGFALENVLKAYLVFENPNWISNGKLARELRSHHLGQLAQRSALVPSSAGSPEILERFEAGLESWARYPCGLSVFDTEPEGVLSANDWHAYAALMRLYGQRLCELLSEKLWKGPHGFEGRWTFDGEFLGAAVRFQ